MNSGCLAEHGCISNIHPVHPKMKKNFNDKKMETVCSLFKKCMAMLLEMAQGIKKHSA